MCVKCWVTLPLSLRHRNDLAFIRRCPWARNFSTEWSTRKSKFTCHTTSICRIFQGLKKRGWIPSKSGQKHIKVYQNPKKTLFLLARGQAPLSLSVCQWTSRHIPKRWNGFFFKVLVYAGLRILISPSNNRSGITVSHVCLMTIRGKVMCIGLLIKCQ